MADVAYTLRLGFGPLFFPSRLIFHSSTDNLKKIVVHMAYIIGLV